jgi:hypothetical protein
MEPATKATVTALAIMVISPTITTAVAITRTLLSSTVMI